MIILFCYALEPKRKIHMGLINAADTVCFLALP